MIDAGLGDPIVLIPGIQGRWEWMAPAVEALARRARVLCGSLCGDAGSGCTVDPASGFDNYVRQVESWLDRAGVQKAAICGVSFGGLVAVNFAAERPARVASLVLVSTPSPTWQPDARARRYALAPLFFTPAFIARAPFRMRAEIVAALPGLGARLAFSARHLYRVLRSPMSPRRMADRVRLAVGHDFVADCGRISAPTLVVTGEPRLDRVVATGGTREYLRLLPGAEARVFERTGHIGLVTKPEAFADIVVEFVARQHAVDTEHRHLA
jgi:pimeloyl-ACP methyl ester carboxylesterase